MVDILEVQEVFFKGMIRGWAAGCDKFAVPDMPGYKEISYQEGKFRLLDRYCISRSKKSAGTTTIWYEDDPIWVMNYGGYYVSRAMGIVKNAIRDNYQDKIFFGGRGPFIHVEGTLIYTNRPVVNNFAKFEGREEVLDTEFGILLGFHDCWGFSLDQT